MISGRIEWGPDIPVNGMSGPHHFPAPEAAGAHPARRQGAGGDGPSASRRDDSDNGTCPAMPGAAGPGNGAAHRRAALFHSSDRHVTAITGKPPSWSNSPTPASTCRKPTATSESRTRGTPPMGVVARPVPPHPPRHPAQENGRNRSARVRDPCRAPYGSRCHGFVDPFRTRFRLCFPIARAVGALHGVSPPPTHGGLRPGNGARSAARILRIFFWTVRLRRIDHTGVAPPVNVAAPPAGSRPSYDWNRFGR